MRIGILGPLTITGARGLIDFTARRQQVVLATLLWNAGRTVSIESLIDAVWGAAPPDTARSQVHICVSRIRKRLVRGGLADLVGTCTPGYRANVHPGDLDLHEFERLAAEARTLAAVGRPTDADEAYTEALALWRGRPFDGVDSQRVTAIAVQLDELRRAALEEHFELRLRTSRTSAVISPLMAAVTEYPYQEGLRALLMTALCRAGRRMEALREYRRAHELFASELGLEPGQRLRRLEQDILSGVAS